MEKYEIPYRAEIEEDNGNIRKEYGKIVCMTESMFHAISGNYKPIEGSKNIPETKLMLERKYGNSLKKFVTQTPKRSKQQ